VTGVEWPGRVPPEWLIQRTIWCRKLLPPLKCDKFILCSRIQVSSRFLQYNKLFCSPNVFLCLFMAKPWAGNKVMLHDLGW
jgi:hypothetical protein